MPNRLGLLRFISIGFDVGGAKAVYPPLRNGSDDENDRCASVPPLVVNNMIAKKPTTKKLRRMVENSDVWGEWISALSMLMSWMRSLFMIRWRKLIFYVG